MNIVFFGSSEYCLPILDAINKNFQLSAIITKENSSSKSYAQSHNIRFFTPANKEELLQLKSDISSLIPDLAIVADYGFIIPAEIFDIPSYRTLNIHFSKLPKFRGPSPVQYTLMLGEKSAWISIIRMDEGLDTGDIIWQKKISLMNNETMEQCNNETTGTLYKKLFNIAASELPDVISQYVKNELKPQKQDHSQATYTKHLTRSDGYIPANILFNAINSIKSQEEEIKKWSLANILDTKYLILNTSIAIERFIRALSPWPGVWTEINRQKAQDNSEKKRLKILQAHLEPLASQGQPLRGYRLVLDQVQLEGKKPVSWKQFTEGYKNYTFR